MGFVMKNKVIVIGGGLAGMVAALAAHKEGAETILIDRGSIGLGTNTALAGGVFAGPTTGYSREEYIKETLEIGRMINCESRVRLVANEAPQAFEFLRSTGLSVKETQGIYAVITQNLNVIPGMLLVKNIAEKVEKLKNVKIAAHFYVTEILQDKNRVYGVKGFDKNGKEEIINAHAVVLATGGAGAIYLVNDNQKNTMGQGFRLAAHAGLDLRDMEFVQFYPIMLAEKHLPSMIAYPPFSEKIRLMNYSGEDILKKHNLGNLNEAIRKKRDEFSGLLFNEASAGGVYMDYSGVPSSAWDRYPLNLYAKLKFDFRTKPVKVSPAVHFFMGGIETDESAQTSLSGLFACGEVAWGLHGANRRGGNALTECLVMGRIAGQNAAGYSTSSVQTERDDLKLKKSEIAAPVSGPLEMTSRESRAKQANGVSFKELRQQIREIAWNNAGISRYEKGLRDGLAAVEKIDAQLNVIAPRNVHEKRLKEDLLSASFVLKAILVASLGRKESRGSFQRKDFPHEDNKNRQKNSCLSYDPEQGDFLLRYV
jgi:succinate dehydrogenase/fumarate reductase flavoprotein subunit